MHLPMVRISNKNNNLTYNIQDTPLERLGMQISLRRRKTGYSLESFATKINVHIEDLVAIELGLATEEKVISQLNQISNGLNLSINILPKFYELLLSINN